VRVVRVVIVVEVVIVVGVVIVVSYASLLRASILHDINFETRNICLKEQLL
jgi:hypothetical protein